jgi:2OG-Fe(II) oxygenase superfamily
MDKSEYSNNYISDRISITPSGYFGKEKVNIQSRENFISSEDLDFLSNAAKNISVWDVTESHYDDTGVMIYDSSYWENRVATSRTLNLNDEKINPVIEKLQATLKKEVDLFFGVDALPTSPAIVRWLPGQFQNPHADKELHEGENAGKPNDFPYYDIAGLFYLNDDYEGGELYFPNQEIQFKPKAGAAYFFPGDLNYIHGVTQITEGIRYVVPFFFTILSHKGGQ